jgi:hypothetical protein
MLTILALVASVPLQARKKPVLYGKVIFKTASGYKKNLTNAKIQLFKITKQRKPGKVRYQTYTSSRGNFAFYKISSGKYYLRVKQNNEVFFQLKRNRKVKVSSVSVKVSSKSIKLPDIIVLR